MAKVKRPLRTGIGARTILMPRVSTPRQEKEGNSLQTQEQRMREYSAERQYNIIAALPDVHTGTELERPVLAKVRAMIRAEEIDVLVIYAYDRLARNETHQAIVLYEAEQHGVSVEAVSEQLDDSIGGRILRVAYGIAAEIEREKILERSMRNIRARVESGKIKPGALPLYGYRWVYVKNGAKWTRDSYAIDEEVAPIIRWMYEEMARGVSTYSVVASLNDRGIPTPSQHWLARGELGGRPLAQRWTRNMVTRILNMTAYKGELTMFRRKRVETYRTDKYTGVARRVTTTEAGREDDAVTIPCPAIVDARLWNVAQARLLENKASAERNHSNPEATLLRAGHVFCGHCRRTLTTHLHRRNGVWHYRCMRVPSSINNLVGPLCPANGVTITAANLDAAVWRCVEAALMDPEDGPSILEQTLEYRKTSRAGHRNEEEHTLASIDGLLAQVRTKHANAQRALDAALSRATYDESVVDDLMERLSQASSEVRRLDDERATVVKTAEAQQAVDEHAVSAIQQVRDMRTSICDADYAMKRRWLWLLGVKVYVYRRGTFDDGCGNNWDLQFHLDGVKALAMAHRGTAAVPHIVTDTGRCTDRDAPPAAGAA